MSPIDAHEVFKVNSSSLDAAIKSFNQIEVSQNEPSYRYKSITDKQSIELMNMLLPSTPAFTDVDSGERVESVINPVNPFEEGFQQYRNYLIHRLMYNYGLRVGEVQLLMTDSIGETLPDSRGKTKFVMVVQNLPDDVDDPRRHKPSIKTQHSYRRIELTEDDFIMVEFFKNRYRAPLFEEKGTPIKAEMVRIVKIIREWVTYASSIEELTQSLDNARYGVTTDMPFAWKKQTDGF
ncbi:hypothetical protein [Vibrio sp. Isolate23]|uniref:hypothetical protein n=1 Tax=Vibrio sp. Isolate23 TaxID=2908533 RepID=UPI001EFDD40D|nr:hypothetical protein [Vibrio sp. Isolate23]